MVAGAFWFLTRWGEGEGVGSARATGVVGWGESGRGESRSGVAAVASRGVRGSQR